MEVGGDEDREIVIEADGAAIEGAMVEAAAGKAVGGDIGAGGLVPHDMGGVEGEIGRSEPDGEATEGAGMTVGGEDFGPEGRKADARGDGFEIESDGGEDIVVKRWGKVGAEQRACDFAKEGRIAAEGFLNRGRKAALDFELDQLAFKRVGVAAAARQGN